MSGNAALFRGIEKDRVSKKRPGTPGIALDADRCAALHNTIILYGWFYSGKKISELKKRTWWSNNGNEKLKSILRPQVVRFLSKIFDVPGHNFFYHLAGLPNQDAMLELADVLDDHRHFDPRRNEKYRYIILYATSKELVSHPAGIVFDQQTGRALLMPTYHHVFNFKDAHLPWQNLETILSAYVDMIEAEKAVAIHDEATISVPEESGSHAEKELTMNKAKPFYRTRPWILQPYTVGDLEACLDIWTRLVHSIEKKAGIKREKPDPNNVDSELELLDNELPLCSRTALNIAGISEGFAYQLLSHARQSEVWFVAPGIRLPKVEEFLQQPFKHILEEYRTETRGMKMPFLFLRCPGTVSAKDAKFRYPFSTVESVPCGLYLDAFPNAQNPFEDACRLVLPIQLGQQNSYARTSDFKPIRRSYSDLYQIDVNPFVMRHGPKLVAVLESWLRNIESGHWNVNEKGVTGGIGVWRQADTRDDWWRYQSEHLCV